MNRVILVEAYWRSMIRTDELESSNKSLTACTCRVNMRSEMDLASNCSFILHLGCVQADNTSNPVSVRVKLQMFHECKHGCTTTQRRDEITNMLGKFVIYWLDTASHIHDHSYLNNKIINQSKQKLSKSSKHKQLCNIKTSSHANQSE